MDLVHNDGRTPAEISKAAGLGEDFIRDLVRRPTQSPTLVKVEALADELNVAPEWIAFGRNSDEVANRPLNNLRILGEVAAGVWREADVSFPPKKTRIFSDPAFPHDAQYLLFATGKSMNRIILDGDLVHCVDIYKADITPKSGDIVIIERRRASGECEVSAKRFILEKNTPVFLPESYAPEWADKRLCVAVDDGDTIAIVARVIRVIRDLAPSTNAGFFPN